MSTKISQELIDQIAKAEVTALIEGLNDPEQKANPAFLAKVRQFLKDNNFVTTSETEGVKEIIKGTTIPNLIEQEDGNIDMCVGWH